MSDCFRKLRTHRWAAMLVVLAFAARALIPAGFMPSAGGAVQICPDGFPAALLTAAGDQVSHAHHHHHDGDPSGNTGDRHDHRAWSGSHCAFAAVATAPPLHFSSHILAALEVSTPPRWENAIPTVQRHRFVIAQPRAPPSLA
jgi:hypothetical protein